jgi:NitT/TauT family transport system substrate-binding protein
MKCRKILFGVAVVASIWSLPALALDKVRYIFPVPAETPSVGIWQIANYLGYYKDEGIEVEFLIGKGGVDAATSVGAGNAEFSGGIGDTSMIVRANGVPVRGIMLFGGGSLTVLSFRKDANIKKIEDLKGKKISVLGYQDTTYYSLLGVLGSAGIKKADVDVQALGPAGMTQLLVGGEVQAMASPPDFAVTAQIAGAETDVIPAGLYTASMAQATIASDKIIKENPDLVRRFTRATMKAFVKFRSDPNAMAETFVEAVPSQKPNLDRIKKIFSLYASVTYGGQTIPGAFDPNVLNKVQDSYLALGVVRRATPVSELYTNEFVTPK